jgi:hypothetical protein
LAAEPSHLASNDLAAPLVLVVETRASERSVGNLEADDTSAALHKPL